MASPFALKLAGIAQDLHDRFHLIDEHDPPLANQIKKFWTSLGLTFPGVDTAWSAVFVSSCVKQAGATKTEFNFNPAHSQFVHTRHSKWAKQHRCLSRPPNLRSCAKCW